MTHMWTVSQLGQEIQMNLKDLHITARINMPIFSLPHKKIKNVNRTWMKTNFMAISQTVQHQSHRLIHYSSYKSNRWICTNGTANTNWHLQWWGLIKFQSMHDISSSPKFIENNKQNWKWYIILCMQLHLRSWKRIQI